jgi:hypothetical protein
VAVLGSRPDCYLVYTARQLIGYAGEPIREGTTWVSPTSGACRGLVGACMPALEGIDGWRRYAVSLLPASLRNLASPRQSLKYFRPDMIGIPSRSIATNPRTIAVQETTLKNQTPTQVDFDETAQKADRCRSLAPPFRESEAA